MASSLNMELKTFLVVLRKVSRGSWRCGGLSVSKHLCCACSAGTPSLQSWEWPCQGGLPSTPQRPRSQASRGGRQPMALSLPSAPDTRTSGCPRVL